jgi:DNA-binding transcriptional regulator YdaS (Cro superfamily)
MELNVYIEKYEESQNQFSKNVGIPQPLISRYVNKSVRPSVANAYKIEIYTDGKVSSHDFYPELMQECITK